MNGLESLIESIEYGTGLHIAVVFLEDYGNEKTRLSASATTHTGPVCNEAKERYGIERCFRCRNTALKLAIENRRAFGGYCPSGVYEYCHPVLLDNAVVCVIFIGNILPENERQRAKLASHFDPSVLEAMQDTFTESDCERTAAILGSYVLYLLEKYPRARTEFNPLIENIKSYIEENLVGELSVSDLTGVFNYNGKYLGRLFKRETGLTLKEYANARRLAKAEVLLRTTRLSVIEVSGHAGFNNVTYFNRLFKKTHGASPVEYRRKNCEA